MNTPERVIWVFYGRRATNGGYYAKSDDYCVILSNFTWYDVPDPSM